MKKKLLIELIIYIVLVVIGIIFLFIRKPKEKEIIIPSDFKIIEEGGTYDVIIPFEQK